MKVHPGMMIRPELDERGITQKDFAKMLGVQASHLSEVLNGKRSLTTDLAMKIEDAIGLPAKILLAAQTQYDLDAVNPTDSDQEHETIAVTIPVGDLVFFETRICFYRTMPPLIIVEALSSHIDRTVSHK